MSHPDPASLVFDAHAQAEEAIRTLGRRNTALPNSQGRFMEIATHHARITGPVSFRSGTGRKQRIPIGPCLVESVGGRSIDIIWGSRGQSSVALPVEEIEAAQEHGHLILLD